MDVLSKVLCRTLNRRLFRLPVKNRTTFQFRETPGTELREVIFTLKPALFARRNHNLGTVTFIDLVEVFDTADQKLPIKLLEKVGCPRKLCDCIQRMHEKLMVIFKLGKTKIEILQTNGVRQGDNMTSVLFFFS